MPPRYCIASGSFNDTAIWSDTDAGNGGATIPTNTDDEIYNHSVVVTGRPAGPGSGNKNISVGPNVEVVIAHATNGEIPINIGKKLTIKGKLSLVTPAGTTYIYSDAFLDIAENGRFHHGNTYVLVTRSGSSYSTAGALDNKGVIEGTRSVDIYAINTQAIPHRVGRVSNVRISVNSVMGVSPLIARFRGIIETDNFTIYPNAVAGAPSIVCDFGDTDIHPGTMEFYWPHTDSGRFVRLIQNGPMMVSRDIIMSGLSTPTSVDWQLGEKASLTFVGSADQTINMPPDVTGQMWRADKPAGKLDLTSFNGLLQGRIRHLIVRATSTIDLGGAPPVLSTTTGIWHCYYGLKADSVSAEGPKTIAEHLQEAMDSCENYGIVTIPSGKTICTKSFKNHTGARVSGTGTLCIRYDGLTNTGIIDSTVNVRYFDRPVLAVLSVSNNVFANTLFSVDLAGSVGDWFRLDWDDESFSKMQSPGILTHGYIDTGDVVWRTLRLTVGTNEGKTDTVTKTIAVHPNPREPEASVASRPVEIDPKKSLQGTPRGNLPAHYRYTLALGKRFMHDTLQLFCPMSESGRALANGSGLYLGRITHSDGRRPDPEEIASASYTVYRLDASDVTVRTPIEAHTDVPLDVTGILLPELVVDENWPFDEIGYNFRHTPDDTTFSPFPIAGREYLVVYSLRPLDQPPRMIFQYRVHVV